MVYSLVNEKYCRRRKSGKWMFPRRLVEEWLEMNILNFRRNGVEKTADSGRLLMAGSDDLLFNQTLTLFHKKAHGIVAFFANLGSMGGIKVRRGLSYRRLPSASR
jgi:hypothetical protein